MKNVGKHDMPGHLFDAIATGGGGAEAVESLAAAQYSKHLALLRGVLETAEAVGHAERELVRRGYGLLAAAQRHDAEATQAVITYPSVSAWALRTLRALREEGEGPHPDATPGRLCAIAAAAATRAGLPAEIDLPVTSGSAMLPSIGAAEVRGGGATFSNARGRIGVLSPSARVELPPDLYEDAPGWSGLRRVQVGQLNVLIDDLDPFRMPAEPDLAPRLSSAKVAAWAAAFHQAWPILTEHHPVIAEEVATAVKVVVPLRRHGEGVVSSSSRDTFGAIALSEPSDPCTLAVTLAHETHHLKLSALLDVVPLTLPDDGRRFYAPWRDDPRPVSGLLQGAYAYLGVSRFWRRQRQVAEGSDAIRAHAEFAQWRAASARVVRTLLSCGQLTSPGTRFVRGMETTLTGWESEPVPEAARALAQRRTGEHLRRWQSANGPIPD
jgi:uncharacterized protein